MSSKNSLVVHALACLVCLVVLVPGASAATPTRETGPVEEAPPSPLPAAAAPVTNQVDMKTNPAVPDRESVLAPFPRSIHYEFVRKDAKFGGCELTFDSNTRYPGTALLTLQDCSALGYRAEQRIFSYLLTADLTLYATMLVDGRTTVEETRLTSGPDPLESGKWRDIYKFLDNSPGSSRTPLETALYTDYPTMDLLSSFYVASNRATRATPHEVEKMSLFLSKQIFVVEMMVMDSTDLAVGDRTLPSTEVLVRSEGGFEMLRFQVVTDERGFVYPARATFNHATLGRLEMFADKVVH